MAKIDLKDHTIAIYRLGYLIGHSGLSANDPLLQKNMPDAEKEKAESRVNKAMRDLCYTTSLFGGRMETDSSKKVLLDTAKERMFELNSTDINKGVKEKFLAQEEKIQRERAAEVIQEAIEEALEEDQGKSLLTKLKEFFQPKASPIESPTVLHADKFKPAA